jgi:hypothetical protein
MSQPTSHAHSLPPEAQQDENGDDGVNLKLIVMIGVVSLIVFIASAVIAWWILREDTQKYGVRGVAPEVRGLAKKQEVGIVDYVPFDSDHRLEQWQQAKAKALNGYGWVDKPKGVIHIPIDEAIKDVVRQAGSKNEPSRGGSAR